MRKVANLLLALGVWSTLVGSASWGQSPGCWGSRGGQATYVPNATGEPDGRTYITTQGGVHFQLPRHPQPSCQRPTSICVKPKMWKFSQAFYQLHHEIWHGVTDPCWLMDPDCCGNVCQQQKSFGLKRIFPNAGEGLGLGEFANDGQRWGDCQLGGGCRNGNGANGCQNGACNARYMYDNYQPSVHGQQAAPAIEVSPVPTPAEPPVAHPARAARLRPTRSILVNRE